MESQSRFLVVWKMQGESGFLGEEAVSLVDAHEVKRQVWQSISRLRQTVSVPPIIVCEYEEDVKVNANEELEDV